MYICTPCLFPTLNNYFVHFTLIIIKKKDMYPFTKYLKFLIKDVKIVWARSMKGISSPPPGTVDRDRRNTPHARTAMSIFFATCSHWLSGRHLVAACDVMMSLFIWRGTNDRRPLIARCPHSWFEGYCIKPGVGSGSNNTCMVLLL